MSDPGESTAILRSGGLMAVGTIISRATGVLRDITIAAALGFGMLADTYALGNALPNIVYILVIGGALNAVFVPQLIRHMHHDHDGGDEFAHRLLTWTGIALLMLSCTAVLAAPWIVRLYATDTYNPAEIDLAIAFARYCLPQIFFYGLYTMLSQVLNARGHFGPPMFAPIINNLVMISTALGFVWLVGTGLTASTISSAQTAVLGVATTAGIALQAIVLVPFARASGYRWRPRVGYRGYGLGKAGSLAGWTIGLVLVNQVGFLVISRLATAANVLAAGTGSVPEGLATYQRAYLVFMLPHSVITISLVTAMLPRMSRAAAIGRLQDVGADVASGIRLVSALVIPASLFLIWFGPAVGTVLFDFGAGKGAASTYTGVVVSAFAIGLLPFSAFYVLLRGWYAVEDTRTPFLVTIIYNVIAIPLTIWGFAIAPNQWKVVALAVCYSLAYWVVVAAAWWRLRRQLGSLPTAGTLVAVLRTGGAGVSALLVAIAMAAALTAWQTGAPLDPLGGWLSESYSVALSALMVGVVFFVGSYLALGRVLRVREIGEVLAALVPRGARRGHGEPFMES